MQPCHAFPASEVSRFFGSSLQDTITVAAFMPTKPATHEQQCSVVSEYVVLAPLAPLGTVVNEDVVWHP